VSQSKLKLNWKYALGELTLIFMGISLAVAFDNWNQQRNKDKAQVMILQEIRTDLLEDSVLIANSIASTQRLMDGVDFLDETLTQNKPYADTISQVLAQVLVFPRVSFISAGYQTLKSTDITLIKNQALRRDLVEYYEYMHPKVIQSMGDVEFEFKTYWTPWILENLLEFRYGRSAIPIDYNALLKDPLLVRNFKISKDNNTGLYYGLLEAQADVEALITHIEEELSRFN
jgi:hypothetical protein